MSLTVYRARRSRNAARVRAALAFETAVIALTLAAIAIVAGIAAAVFHF